MSRAELWSAYLAAHLALHSAIDQQGSTPADDAACVAGVRKTIDSCRVACAAVDKLCGADLGAFERRYARGDF